MTKANDFKLEKKTLRKKIRNYIIQQIANGTYRGGERIVETKLAKELEVSQAPVREAFLELTAMGILEERPYSGTFIRSIGPDDVEDIYNTRAFIEEYASRLAAKNVTDEQLANIENLLHKMDQAEDNTAFLEMDIDFHTMVVDAAQSPALKRMWETLQTVEWTQISLMSTKASLSDLARQHWNLFHYLQNHDERSAGAYMYLHIKNFGNELKTYLSEQMNE
ncbi:MAG: GntR family transcriptional regulator [Lachnospiraceae bacterium]|nr:GntR family transcriptional regulator [Lachnospiraceae bacterium]